jgi:glutaredoxin
MLKYLLLVALFLGAQVKAEAYRWTDPATGRTVISDLPPPGNVKQARKTQDTTPTSEGRSFALQRAVSNFPVTLYTAPDYAESCDQARLLLKGRGIPFTEKVLKTAEDIAEAKAAFGEAYVPLLTVGRQNVRGFDAAAYNNLLDLAEYPAAAASGSKNTGSPTK